MTIPASAPPPPRRVLLIKPSALGDVVTAMPVLRGLRRTFPEAHLAWLVATPFAPLIAHDGDLDEVILFDRRRLGRAWRSPAAGRALGNLLRGLRAGRFDWVIDLQGLLRSALFAAATRARVRAGFADARECAATFYTHRIAAVAAHTVDRNIELARAMGIDARPSDMTLQVAPAASEFAERLLRREGLRRGGFLACVPPTRWKTKQYPERYWRKVVADLAGRTRVVLLGAAGDRALCERIAASGPSGVVNLAGQTGVGEMAAVIAAAAGVVCCDSAAKFIANAVGTDVVVLVGPTRLERTGPYPTGTALLADVPCQGCLQRRCRHVTCMQSIRPSEVVCEATKMLVGQEA